MNEVGALNAGIQGGDQTVIAPTITLQVPNKPDVLQSADQKQLSKLLDVKKQIALVVFNFFKGTYHL